LDWPLIKTSKEKKAVITIFIIPSPFQLFDFLKIFYSTPCEFSFFIKGTLLLAGNFLVILGSQGSVKGCLEPPGFEPQTLRFPA